MKTVIVGGLRYDNVANVLNFHKITQGNVRVECSEIIQRRIDGSYYMVNKINKFTGCMFTVTLVTDNKEYMTHYKYGYGNVCWCVWKNFMEHLNPGFVIEGNCCRLEGSFRRITWDNWLYRKQKWMENCSEAGHVQ